MLDQLIFGDEAATARVPVPFLTINTVGPTIMRFGTPEQKAFYLPRIAAGEIHFSIGYSEPEAGTDLASLRTTAVRVQGDGEADGEYVIDGQKMWTSLIQYADYVWLACRTDRRRSGTGDCRSSSCRPARPGSPGRRCARSRA
jgi:alkylation response protein AidB-like acyl-CoA dehydrogenase